MVGITSEPRQERPMAEMLHRAARVLSLVRQTREGQLYDPRSASPALRITEEQVPNLFGGYHHRWSPSIHTLFLAARLEDRFLLSDADVLIRGVARDNTGVITNTLQGIARSLSIDPAASP